MSSMFTLKRFIVLSAVILIVTTAQLDSRNHALLSAQIMKSHRSHQETSNLLQVRNLDVVVSTLLARGAPKDGKASAASGSGASSSNTQTAAMTKALSNTNLLGSAPSGPRPFSSGAPKSLAATTQPQKSTSPTSQSGSSKSPGSQGRSRQNLSNAQLASSPGSSPGSSFSRSPKQDGKGSLQISPKAGQLEEAQANIAREQRSGPSSPRGLSQSPPVSPPGSPTRAGQRALSPPRQQGAMLPPPSSNVADRSRSSSPVRARTQADHIVWLNQVKASTQVAEGNARGWAQFRRQKHLQEPVDRVRNVNARQVLKSEARSSRADARQKADVANRAMQERPATSPTTRQKIKESNSAGVQASFLGEIHSEAQHQAIELGKNEKRWRDVPDHIKSYARTITRSESIEAYTGALAAQYNAKLSKARAAQPHADEQARTQALTKLVDSNRRYRAAADTYYTKHSQYQDTRTAFGDGSSSDEETKTLDGAPDRGHRI